MFDQNKYINQYKKDHCDHYNLFLPKGSKELIKAAALQEGVSVTGLISEAVLWHLGYKTWEDAIKSKEDA